MISTAPVDAMKTTSSSSAPNPQEAVFDEMALMKPPYTRAKSSSKKAAEVDNEGRIRCHECKEKLDDCLCPAIDTDDDDGTGPYRVGSSVYIKTKKTVGTVTRYGKGNDERIEVRYINLKSGPMKSYFKRENLTKDVPKTIKVKRQPLRPLSDSDTEDDDAHQKIAAVKPPPKKKAKTTSTTTTIPSDIQLAGSAYKGPDVKLIDGIYITSGNCACVYSTASIQPRWQRWEGGSITKYQYEDSPGSWRWFHPQLSAALREAAYHAIRATWEFTVSIGGAAPVIYEYNFRNSTQVNRQSGTTRAIRAVSPSSSLSSSSSSSSPSKMAENKSKSKMTTAKKQNDIIAPLGYPWERMVSSAQLTTSSITASQGTMLQLPSTSPIYKKIEAQFLQDLARPGPHKETKLAVNCIWVVAHQQRWIEYETHFNTRHRLASSSSPVTELFPVYHGTDEAAAKKIVAAGRIDRFYSKSSVAYGSGAYFALHPGISTASYSDRKALPNGKLGGYVFMCRVVDGKREATQSTTTELSPGYDVGTDSLANPTMLIVFDPAASYPMFLILFEETS